MLEGLKHSILEICQPILDICTQFGHSGLFALAFIESSFFPIPPDFLYIPMILNGEPNPYKLALLATVGSVAGAMFGYLIGVIGGRPIARKFFKEDLLHQAEDLFKKYGSMAILIAAFTPVPYKVFTISAGIAHMEMSKFILFSLLGRGGRFFFVTFLLIHFGQAIMENFFKLTLVGVGILLIVFLFYKFKQKTDKS